MNLKNRSSPPPRWLIWSNVILTVVLLLAGVWYLITQVNIEQVVTAFSQADSRYILLSLLTVLLTLLLKAWRWQLMYASERRHHSFSPFFWSLMLGLYINVIVPLLRLGEIARMMLLHQKTGLAKTRTLSTLVIEKLLEVIILGLTIYLLISLTILPSVLQNQIPDGFITAVALSAFIVLILMAVFTEWFEGFVQKLIQLLPARFQAPFDKLFVSGLRGLSSLRNYKLTLAIIAVSLVIGVLSVLTSYTLFFAFHLPYGLREAAIIHIFVSIALVPPSTPAKIGVFDGAVAFILLQFGLQNEAVLVSYTILFHIIVILPQIVFGIIASSQSNWRWSAQFPLTQSQNS